MRVGIGIIDDTFKKCNSDNNEAECHDAGYISIMYQLEKDKRGARKQTSALFAKGQIQIIHF